MTWPAVRSLVKQWFYHTADNASYAPVPRPFYYHSIRPGLEKWFQRWRGLGLGGPRGKGSPSVSKGQKPTIQLQLFPVNSGNSARSLEIHLFSFVFGQCSITIRRQIRQFVIEQNTSTNSTTDCPISKTDWTLVIVNWTLCTTFGISKSFGQWAGSFITLVRMWEVYCETVWNECRIVLKICHSLRTIAPFPWAP